MIMAGYTVIFALKFLVLMVKELNKKLYMKLVMDMKSFDNSFKVVGDEVVEGVK